MLQLQDVTKSYTTGNFTQTALDGVSIAFRSNEFVAILGPSGSGKTTMLNIIGGLDHYDTGDLIIDGVSTKKYKDADWDAYRNNQVGFVFQAYNLIPHQTILSNVEMALTLSGVSPAERKRRALAALANVGLEQHANKKPNQLSGGQAQRVAIARALVNNPTILLADEPTGALDSKTSVDVMDLLTKIADDRLVVMVTHNPELAEQYANRIVRVSDGKIVDDTNPFDPASEPTPEPKPVRRTSMSFFTALSLSFQNLMTKLGRTIMTAFAGSIGIIGIALILSLATGANNYIHTVEEETLSEYPLQIFKSGFSLSSMLGTGDADGESAGLSLFTDTDEDSVRVSKMLTTMVKGVGSNDLASLKAFLDANGGNIFDYVTTIEYTYNVKPLVYAQLPTGKWQQANPDTAISAYTTSSYSSSFLGSMYSSDIFHEMPNTPSLYENAYTVSAGRWPERWNEVVIVTSSSGSIADFMLYDLGLRDAEELAALMDAIMNGTGASGEVDLTSYKYEDLLNIDFRLVNVADTYVYDEVYGVWMDKRDDAEFISALVAASEPLHVVGIVRPTDPESAAMLSSGVCYLPSLTQHVVGLATTSPLVQAQLADPEVDVFTGKRFDDPEAQSGMDLSQMFVFDEEVFNSAFSFNANAIRFDTSQLSGLISAERLGQILQENMSQDILEQLGQFAADDAAQAARISQIVQQAIQAYIEAAAEDPELTPQIFFGEGGQGYNMIREVLGENPTINSQLAEALQGVMNSVIAQVGNDVTAGIQRMMAGVFAQLPKAIRVDTDLMGSAFQVNMTEEDLSNIMLSMMQSGQRSYTNNLSILNYVDLDDPAQIDIYPKDFEAKAVVMEILDKYNSDLNAAGEKEKVVTYTDLVGTLMSSVTDIIDVISYMLIAFVSISLIVSSIMIGIITYISVLERKKEIGILRAIGARKRDVSNVFNAETVIEGLIAGLLGVGITAFLCIPIRIIVFNLFDVPNIAYLPISAAIILVGISVFLTLISGLIPASAAAKADPVVALRSE